LFASPDDLNYNPSIIITDASNKSSLNGGMHDPFDSMSSMNSIQLHGLNGMGGEDAFGFTANASIQHNNTPVFGSEGMYNVNVNGNGNDNGAYGNLGGFPFPHVSPGDMDMQTLESFLAYLPAQYQHHPSDMQHSQQLHLPQGHNIHTSPSIWSNHTSPELLSLHEDPFTGNGNGNGGIMGNAALLSLYGAGQTLPMQPITNAVEQSMVGLNPVNTSNNSFSASNSSNNSGTSAVDISISSGSCLEVNPATGTATVSGSCSGSEPSTSCSGSASSESSSSADGSKGGENVMEGDSLRYSIPVIADSDSAAYPTVPHLSSTAASKPMSTSTSAILHSPLHHAQSIQSIQSTHPVQTSAQAQAQGLSSSNAQNPGLSLPRAVPLLPITATTGATLDTTMSAKGNEAQPMRISPPDIQLVQRQIFYYFNRVRKMQYCFAGETTKDVLRDMVVSNRPL
jgi:hypothetical protein